MSHAKFYGRAKVHKLTSEDVNELSLLSNLGTASYHVAKYLAKLFSHLTAQNTFFLYKRVLTPIYMQQKYFKWVQIDFIRKSIFAIKNNEWKVYSILLYRHYVIIWFWLNIVYYCYVPLCFIIDHYGSLWAHSVV